MSDRELHNRLRSSGIKLAMAESCTGGALAASLTQFEGASDYFLGGVVAYSNELKESLLKVSPKTLEVYGSVSSETVIEMVVGLFGATSADIAIAVSGILGPAGGTEDKPVGTVWMAIGRRSKKIESHLIPLELGLTRLEYRDKVVAYLLEALWKL